MSSILASKNVYKMHKCSSCSLSCLCQKLRRNSSLQNFIRSKNSHLQCSWFSEGYWKKQWNQFSNCIPISQFKNFTRRTSHGNVKDHQITCSTEEHAFFFFHFDSRNARHWFPCTATSGTSQWSCIRTSLHVNKLPESWSNNVCICCWCRCIQTKAKFQYNILF